MICPHCGKKTEKPFRHCPSCGKMMPAKNDGSMERTGLQMSGVFQKPLPPPEPQVIEVPVVKEVPYLVPAPEPEQKKRILPWVIGSVLTVAVIGGAVFGAWKFGLFTKDDELTSSTVSEAEVPALVTSPPLAVAESDLSDFDPDAREVFFSDVRLGDDRESVLNVVENTVFNAVQLNYYAKSDTESENAAQYLDYYYLPLFHVLNSVPDTTVKFGFNQNRKLVQVVYAIGERPSSIDQSNGEIGVEYKYDEDKLKSSYDNLKSELTQRYGEAADIAAEEGVIEGAYWATAQDEIILKLYESYNGANSHNHCISLSISQAGIAEP